MAKPPSRGFLAVQALTLARLPLAAGFAAVVLLVEGPSRIPAAVALLLLLEASDLADGLLARRLGVVSELGKMLDPLADSASRLVVYWALATAGLALPVLPLAMALRDVTVAYARLELIRHGGSVAARWSGKVKAVVQGTGAFALLLAPSAELADARGWVSWTVLLVTLASAVEYVRAAAGLYAEAARASRQGTSRSPRTMK